MPILRRSITSIFSIDYFGSRSYSPQLLHHHIMGRRKIGMNIYWTHSASLQNQYLYAFSQLTAYINTLHLMS